MFVKWSPKAARSLIALSRLTKERAAADYLRLTRGYQIYIPVFA